MTIMAFLSSPPPQKGIVVTVPFLVLAASFVALTLFFLATSISPPCSCSLPPPAPFPSSSSSSSADRSVVERVSATADDVNWVKDQIVRNGLRMQDNILRKGINPRTRAHQLQDLIQYKGISHYGGVDSDNHTALPCPGELLVEEHHSNYGEPWAGGRDVFEFLAEASNLSPNSQVLEIGCGTLRVGLHFIRYLSSGRFHCLERDELSLMAALRYELPSQGLLHKRPVIVRGDDMDFTRFGPGVSYDLIYASAVFLHMPDRLVKKLSDMGLEYIGKRTHDSLLFNHYEIWFEFRRSKNQGRR